MSSTASGFSAPERSPGSVSYWPERMISTTRVERLILDLLHGGIDGFARGADGADLSG